ncbi:hypothetical protein ACRQ1B_19095 [Rhizobium panacihumi]|uniref:hypothetical protein n=1 Tax=Rhizobium panacihumi TaxID=2008450 RepID=UPI003D799B4C
MGILSDRLISMEPWLHDSPDTEFSDDGSPATAPLTVAVATAFLDCRWAISATQAAPPLPVQAAEQPLFDALHASEEWSAEDGSLFVEFDGFLIDRQTAAVACAGISPPIAA